jgi:nucleotide-binding universal stress UspA family protein
MVLKNIMVLMDSHPHAADRLDLAITLAQQHGADLVGLNAVTHSLLPVKKNHREADLGEQFKEMFFQKTREARIDARWINADVKTLGGGVAEVVNHYATFVDLVVVGQPVYGAKDKNAPDNLPERVVLGSGKPVLIVPYSGAFSCVGGRVLVAWRSGRESSRALSDALPLLRHAELVNVFEVNPSEREKDNMESLRRFLASHKVQAGVETSSVTALGVGDVLLNRVADEGSDLLVMGVYADPHFGPHAVGEVARHVLRHMTVPVLMSH